MSALLSLGSFALREVSYHAVRTLNQSCGKVFMERSQGLLSIVSHICEPCTWAWASVEVDSLASSQAFQWLELHWLMTATVWETSKPELPIKPRLNFWSTETEEDKNVCCFIKPLSFGVFIMQQQRTDTISGFPAPWILSPPSHWCPTWIGKDLSTLCIKLTC